MPDAFSIDQIMAEIKTGRERRALHGGPEPTWPERLVGEIERLRAGIEDIAYSFSVDEADGQMVPSFDVRTDLLKLLK
jgi:hypothetical protein